MTRPLKIAARPATFVVKDLKRRGTNADALLKEVGLRRSDLADPENRIPYEAVLGLIERAATITGDASYGLRLGASRDQHDSGLIGFVLLNSGTLFEALLNLQRYFRVVGEGEDFKIERGGPHVTLKFRETEPGQRGLRHDSDYIAAMIVRACRDMTRKRFVSPVRAEFIHARPNQKVEYAEFLGCPVRFHAEWDALVFAEETLRLPVAGADNRLLKALEHACHKILGPTPRKQDIVHDVRELIIDRLTKGAPRFHDVAGQLNMGSRTLERRLSERGTTFSTLLDDVRCGLAKQYLADTDVGLERLAYLLGYSEPAALVRAFKRWTSMTPMQFRDSSDQGKRTR
jgi:AraC-like DNA-binding protein